VNLFQTLDDTNEGSVNNENLEKNYNPVWDVSGNLIEFTIPSTSVFRYMRIQCGGMSAASIVTINETID
jgi:hypothetical protein